MVKLVIEEKGQPARDFVIKDAAEKIKIGRNEDNEVQIAEPKASREHCLLERTPDGFKLVDMESSNGTRVNGQMVNAKIIEDGDTIQIGDTIIRFVAEIRSRAIVPEVRTRIIEKPKVRESARSSDRQPVALAQGKRPPWELFYIAGGIIVLLIAGTAIFNKLSSDSAAKKALALANEALGKALKEGDIGVKVKLYDDAFDKFQNLCNQYPDSSEAKTAQRIVEDAKTEFKHVKKWHSSFRTLLAETGLQSPVTPMGSLLDLKRRLVEFTDQCPFSELNPLILDEIAKVDGYVSSGISKVFNDKKSEIDLSLSMEEYGNAIRRWEFFIEDFKKYPEVAEKARAKIENVKNKARTDFKLLLVKGDELIDQKLYQQAQVLFRNAVKKYEGTECAIEASMRLRVIKLMVEGADNRSSAEAEIASRQKVYNNAAEADVFSKKRDFDKAIDIYGRILADTQDRDVKEEFSARVADLNAVKALFGYFTQQASSGKLSSKPWDLGSNTKVFVTGADSDWVRFGLEDGKGTTQKRWKMFTDKELLSLFKLAELDAEKMFALGVFCLLNNLPEAGESVLADAFNRDSSLISRINPLIARMRESGLPAGGYVPYHGKWYSIKDREIAIEDEKIASLVDTVHKGGLDSAGQAVDRLKAIPRGLEPLLRALRDKREALKKRIAGNLQFNNQTLVTLKTELDKRRAYALDFIEDEERYPDKKVADANVYRLAQQEVDKRVKAVEEIWTNPYSAAIQLNAAASSINNDLKRVNDWLASIDKSFDRDKEDKIDMDYIASLANSQLSIRTFSTETKEQKMIAYNAEVMKWNENNKEAGQIERRQVAILNEYRMMLGRRCVKIEEMLVRAARGHSAYMASSGQFAHIIENHPNGRAPSDRCAKEGYSGAGVSENISMGHSDAQGTHVAWYNSSGHHRNMINREWTVMGAGLSGVHWTQNFGNKDTTLRDKTSPSVTGWPGSEWRGGMAKKKSE